MKYLILSDVHANYQALSKVLQNETYDEVLYIGDLIGYAADPYLCYKTFLETGGVGVMGNHEYGTLHPDVLGRFSENARKGILHTIKSIPPEYLTHMVTLPEVLAIDNFVLCHAMLGNPLSFQYVFPENKESSYLLESFQKMKEKDHQVMFTGHTHKPCIFKEKEDKTIEMYLAHDGDLYLDDARYVINAGSVGQSRNGVPKAHYVLYDPQKKKVSFRSMDYDVKKAAERIFQEGLPEFSGQRLYLGT